jgi:hypothetical protein
MAGWQTPDMIAYQFTPLAVDDLFEIWSSLLATILRPQMPWKVQFTVLALSSQKHPSLAVRAPT